jgi:hypothetical protein
MTLKGPTAEQLKRMREEIQEDPDVTQQDLAHLRHWLNKQPHLPHHIGEFLSALQSVTQSSHSYRLDQPCDPVGVPPYSLGGPQGFSRTF